MGDAPQGSHPFPDQGTRHYSIGRKQFSPLNVVNEFLAGGATMHQMSHRDRLWACVGVCLIGATSLAPPGMASPVDTSPFVYAVAGYTDNNGVDHVNESLAASGPVFASLSAPGQAAARTDFGSIGYRYGTTSPGDNASWPSGIFSDGFILSGSSGTGPIDLYASIHGSAPAGVWDQGYSLFISSNPFSLQSVLEQWADQAENCPPDTGCDYDNQIAGATRVLNRIVNNGDAPASVVLHERVTVEYGTPFFVLVFFGGDGNRGVDFYNSATLGLSAPSGSSLDAYSGTVYATAVNEPSEAALMLFGLAVMLARTSVSKKRESQSR